MIWYFTKKRRRCDAWAGALSWWSCQSPVAHSWWIIWIVSAEVCSSLMQNLMQICCSTCSVILNMMATQSTCLMVSTTPLTSTVDLSLFTHVHSSPLSLAARLHRCHPNCSCYINNSWNFSSQTLYAILSKYFLIIDLNFFFGKYDIYILFI